MDLLKKHYEKIVLAVTLVALIGSAVYLALRVSRISSQIEELPVTGPKSASAHVSLAAYSNALLSLSEPALWTNAPVKIFVRNVPDVSNQRKGTNTNDVLTLVNVVRKPFKLLFKTYSYDAATSNGYNFQINFQFRARTFFIHAVGDPIKDHYEDTGYKITSFERKLVTVNDPSLGVSREKDFSTLTVQHDTGKPVVLVLGKESEDEEPVAQVRCAAAGSVSEYRRGQTLECDRKTYKVFDIDFDQKQMVIVDTQTQERRTIKSQ